MLNDKVIYKYFKYNYGKRNGSFDFRLKKIDETRNYLLKNIKYNDLISEKHKKVCRIFNYFEHFLAFFSVVSGYVSVSVSASLIDVPLNFASSAVGLKTCTLTAAIKKYNSVIKNEREKNNKIVLLVKTKLNTIDVLISKALINLRINDGKFASVDNVLREYNKIK